METAGLCYNYLERHVSIWLLVVYLLVTWGAAQTDSSRKEFCVSEVFEATCGPRDVILMKHAKYGRMERGRCVQMDYGYVGCGTDVMDVADSMCSGRRSCRMGVGIAELEGKETGCPPDFKNYLETEYTCLKVITASKMMCRSSPYMLLEQPTGTLASVVTMETGCGSTGAPWVIRGEPGQHIEIKLVDFGHGSDNALPGREKCFAHATVKENLREGGRDVVRSETICGGSQRESTAYTSQTNQVKVIFITGHNREDSERAFLLNYTIKGCGTPRAPQGGWLRRTGDKLVYGCNGTSVTQAATCNGSHWDQPVRNCTHIRETQDRFHGGTSRFRISHELAVVLILAIALVVASMILCLGVVCMRRIRGPRRAERTIPYYSSQSEAYPGGLARPADVEYHTQKEMFGNYEQYRNGENVYASISEGPLQPYPLMKSPLHERCTCPTDSAGKDPNVARFGTPYSSLEHSGSAPGQFSTDTGSPGHRQDLGGGAGDTQAHAVFMDMRSDPEQKLS